MDQSTAEPGIKSKIPDTFLILLILALVAFASTWLFSPGRFGLAPSGRIDPAAYSAAAHPRGAPVFGTEQQVGLLNFPFEGLVTGDRGSATVGLMAFILVIGGVFGVIMRTGAVDRALTALIGDPADAKSRPVNC